MLKIAVVKGYLPTSARKTEHPRAKAMRMLVEGMAASEGDELVSFSVQDGKAFIQTKRDDTLKYIQAQFGEIEDVKTELKNAVQAEREKNIAAQKRADKFNVRMGRKGGQKQSVVETA